MKESTNIIPIERISDDVEANEKLPPGRACAARGFRGCLVGTHGRTGITKLLLGSIAEQVLRTADHDVLAVPPSATGKDRVAVKSSEVLVPGWIDDIRNGDCFNANPRCF